MVSTLYGKKVGMTTWFEDNGRKSAVTVVQVYPSKVVQVKTKSRDGYDALVLGFDPAPEKKLDKPSIGRFKKAGVAAMRQVRETRADDTSKYQVGQDVGVDQFEKVTLIHVIGVSKGRGFTGPVKRYNFQRGRETHGNKMHRSGGSVGNHTDPAKIWKGKRMAGQMGNEQVTVRNLEVVKVIKEKNLMLIRGAVPGCNRRLVEIRKVKEAK